MLLQSPDLDLAAAVQLIQAQISILQEYRCNEKWDLLWIETEAIARSLNVNTENISRMDRRSQLPCRLQVDSVVITSVGAHTSLSAIEPKIFFRTEYYYPIIDNVLQELNSRFSSLNQGIMCSIQALSPSSNNFLDLDTLQPLQPLLQHYEIDEAAMLIEVPQVKRIVSNTPDPDQPLCIYDLLDIFLPLKVAFPTFLKTLKLALTLCVTSSCLKRLKSYLRSTMSDERLNSLAVISIERDFSFSLSLDDIVDKFNSMDKNRRMLLS